jgi:hypothetical protein
MVDTAANVETGFLGHEQNTAAARAIGPTEIFDGSTTAGRESETGGLDSHRRFSSTPSRTQNDLVRRLWRHRDEHVKLSWRNPQLSQ